MTPFMYVYRVHRGSFSEVVSAVDSMLIMFQNFIDLTGDMTVEDDPDDADYRIIKVVIEMKGLKDA